ncbi:MAG: phosphate--acyl-ACP acyltransferase, partial [Clostridiaceae bacterium]
MKIAIDGMGGDYSPHAVVQGCIEAVKEYKNIEIIITGHEDLISRELSKHEGYYDNISILDAKETIN